MILEVTDELRNLCRGIASEGRTASEWAKIQSDDMFQTDNFVGGFERLENAFCFSYYAPSGAEFWFQITLQEVVQIAQGELTTVQMRPAET